MTERHYRYAEHTNVADSVLPDDRPPSGCLAVLVAMMIVVAVVVYLVGIAYMGGR